MNHLLCSENFTDLTVSKANPITAWHGTSAKNIESIAWYGLLNLSKDPGKMSVSLYNTLFTYYFVVKDITETEYILHKNPSMASSMKNICDTKRKGNFLWFCAGLF